MYVGDLFVNVCCQLISACYVVAVIQDFSVNCWCVAGKARSLVGHFCPSVIAVTICGSVVSSWNLVTVHFTRVYTVEKILCGFVYFCRFIFRI